MKKLLKSSLIAIFLVITLVPEYLTAQSARIETELDKKVQQFLSEQSGQWHDMNVPTVDGKKLFDLVLEGNYKSALEIGTSTGYSGIYIAWALSKTGGKLITIDINEGRLDILPSINERDSSGFYEAMGSTPSRFLAGSCFRPLLWFDTQAIPVCPTVKIFFAALISAFSS